MRLVLRHAVFEVPMAVCSLAFRGVVGHCRTRHHFMSSIVQNLWYRTHPFVMGILVMTSGVGFLWKQAVLGDDCCPGHLGEPMPLVPLTPFFASSVYLSTQDLVHILSDQHIKYLMAPYSLGIGMPQEV